MQAIPSCRNLGLERLLLVARLAPRYEGSAASFFQALSGHCYLYRFARVMLRGEYVLEICVPPDLAERCAGVFMDLERAGLFTALEIFTFDDSRNPEGGSQPALHGGEGDAATSVSRPAPRACDEIDLLVIRELVRDASRTPPEMARDLKVSAAALRLHYNQHVLARGLVDLRGRPVTRSPPSLARRVLVREEDEVIELSMILEGGTPEEVAELSGILHSTPYVSRESHGSAFWAEALVPKNDYPGFLRIVDAFASRTGNRTRTLIIDQRRSGCLMEWCRLFDAESGKWSLDSRAAIKVLGTLTSLARVS